MRHGSERARDYNVREEEERQARLKHNQVDTRERCDRCGGPLYPSETVVGDFEQYHAKCRTPGEHLSATQKSKLEEDDGDLCPHGYAGDAWCHDCDSIRS